MWSRTYFSPYAAKPELQLIHEQIYQFNLDAIVLDMNSSASTLKPLFAETNSHFIFVTRRFFWNSDYVHAK